MTNGVPFHVVPACVDDAAVLEQIAQTSFRDTFAAMPYPADELEAFLNSAMGRARFAGQIADPDYAIALARDAQGAAVGYIKMGPNDLPMPPGQPPRARARELHQLYMLPAAKGSGAAAALMDWGMAEARSRNATAVYLSVFVGNVRAQRFYARYGFVEIGKNPFRVGSTVDDDRVWKADL